MRYDSKIVIYNHIEFIRLPMVVAAVGRPVTSDALDRILCIHSIMQNIAIKRSKFRNIGRLLTTPLLQKVSVIFV